MLFLRFGGEAKALVLFRGEECQGEQRGEAEDEEWVLEKGNGEERGGPWRESGCRDQIEVHILSGEFSEDRDEDRLGHARVCAN